MPSADKEDTDRIIEAFVYLYAETRRATKEVARHHGLTGPQVSAIKMLEAFGDLSLSALSARMSAKNSTITGVVDRMERNELVRRTRSEADRRVVLIRLTQKGRALAEAIPVASLEIFATALDSLPKSDRDKLRGILRRLSDAVRVEVEKTESQLQGDS